MSWVGQSVKCIDAVSKVSGQTLYRGDVHFPNQVQRIKPC